ncbi:pyruvate dehydrogenase (acetyl-transferring) E1 component subunit alpha [Mycoplasma zalophi]|uniref:Pyruvate dehydrogenase E1 component subunit alpha n=1 Tax=Mycoplasma zalophi TaxID=191287 RepID=A0ABS6DPJ7_9MOLU|nr:pyruvate dehydrogenase (acetyl-transferring) E1 component subunit alpha [Mycoplasma zalophi]MBU4692237.1 pyruvate dehydrogenase (acetyl-transferring) E1 component subunit alpha [Mycoplasma zalophi]
MDFKYIKPGLVMSDKDEMIRLVDVNGDLIDKNYKTTATDEELLQMYKYMIMSRQWDMYALQLQKTGRLGTFAPNLGEEAFLSALGAILNKKDWLVPHYRALATMLAHGVTMKNMFNYWRGSEQGAHFAADVNSTPMQVVIGSQLSHAAGVAYALKQQKVEKPLVLTLVGNGGTNEGEFHESLNIAAVRHLPVFYVVANNQWAISVPEHNSYAVPTLSQRAMSYNIPGLRVDGNDLLASYEVAKEVAEYIRQGNGPVLVEFVTWRQGQHTTSDNPRVYRSRELEEEKEKWEPMHRIEKFLFEKGILTEELKTQIWDEQFEAAKEAYAQSTEDLAKEGYEDIFKYTYKELTPELKEQFEEGKKYL